MSISWVRTHPSERAGFGVLQYGERKRPEHGQEADNLQCGLLTLSALQLRSLLMVPILPSKYARFLSLSFSLCVALITWLGGLVVVGSAQAQINQPPSEQVSPDPWPKSAQLNGAKYTLYEPQLESWDSYNLAAHAAVSVTPSGAKYPSFGAINISAVTIVDREAKTVRLQNIRVEKANFPSAPAKAAQYQRNIQAIIAKGPTTMPLDKLQAALAVLHAEEKGRAVPVMNDPPKFIFSESAAVMVSIDGQPIWGVVPQTSLERAINTRALLLRDKSGKFYLHLFDGFMEADALSGLWTVAKQTPHDADKVAQQLAKDDLVDLMEGPPNEQNPSQKPSLRTKAPTVYVETIPTELIVTEGQPDWIPITGTNLLYVKNTTADLVKNLNDQQIYVLVTGRWFRALNFTGPWQYVPGISLPPDFAKIPDDSPKENMKASIPGTPQAQEAIIAAEIPQMATVNRTNTNFTPVISGAPILKPIPSTPLSYVFNASDPIIQVSPAEWYAVHNGVWFTSTSVQTSWLVASSVPSVIYSIPPSSPVYYVTYVRVYDSTPQTVVVGYTPGYMGTIVSADGVVVYGSGYAYPAYITSTVYYPAPSTYGYATGMTWTPWLGWAFGFGMGWAWGASTGWYGAWGWGPAPYWGAYHGYYGYGAYGAAYGYHGGAAVWGPGGWAGTTGNVYRRYGATSVVSRTSAGYNAWTGNAWNSQVGHSYNSVTGRASAGQRGSVQNVYTGNSAYGARGATYNPTTGVGAAGERGTFTNAATGQSTTMGRGLVKGPAGGTTRVGQVNNNYYADHDGNVYRANADTDTFQKYGANGWNNVDRNQAQSLQSEQQARDYGASRAAGSSWGGNWGGWKGGEDLGGGGHSWGDGRFGGGYEGFGGFRGGGGFRGRR
jgi:hypothetical protein